MTKKTTRRLLITTLLASALCTLSLPSIASADESLGGYSGGAPARGFLFRNEPQRVGGPYLVPGRSSLVIDQETSVAIDGTPQCTTYFVVTKVDDVATEREVISCLKGNTDPLRVWDNPSNRPVLIWIKARLRTWFDDGKISVEYLYRPFPE